MKKTGIKVWVLTGDKIETAENIGFSAGLLDNSMDKFYLKDASRIILRDDIDSMIERIKTSEKQKAIIVAGESLTEIDRDDQLRQSFLDMSDYADVVLACRVSPKQKADIVNMIRKRFPKKVTLSIGDGANDVNMIL